jgi:cell division transport system permease protein
MSRTRPTYLYAVTSVALVLFILGFFGLIALHAHSLVQIFKERVDIWMELRPDIQQDDVARIVGEVRNKPFVKQESVRFISREQAAATMRRELGDESLLEELPGMMRDVVQFNVRAAYLQSDSLAAWRSELRRDSAVADLYYEAANIGNIGANVEKIGWISLGLGFLLIFAAVTLIHNTIRLALYANRFIIKNQELVGATWGFIIRPYLRRGILNGLLSAALAIIALVVLLWWGRKTIPELKDLEDLNGILMIFTGVVMLGMLISGLSTYLVVHKFLKLRIDDLY